MESGSSDYLPSRIPRRYAVLFTEALLAEDGGSGEDEQQPSLPQPPRQDGNRFIGNNYYNGVDNDRDVDREEPSIPELSIDYYIDRQPAQYPGAVRVGGTTDDEEGTVVIGYPPPQNSHSSTGRRPRLPRRQDRNRISCFLHARMDQIGLAATHASPPDDGEKSCRTLLCAMGVIFCALIGTWCRPCCCTCLFFHFRTTGPSQNQSTQDSKVTKPPTATPTRAVATAAPDTSFQWELSGEIVGQADTFGFSVVLDDLGKRIAIAAPGAHDAQGQVEVYEKNQNWTANDGDLERWTRLGEPILGDFPGDEASFGMDLSADGDTLAVGCPGKFYGHVKVYEYRGDEGWTQKGQTLVGPSLDSRFGEALSLNLDGRVLVVGAPLHHEDRGMFQVYQWNMTRWTRRGTPRHGRSSGDRFATSVGMNKSGDSIAVGVPNCTTPDTGNAGMVQVFQYVVYSATATHDDCTYDCWTDISMGNIIGNNRGSQFGRRVSSLFQTPLWPFYFVSSSSSSDHNHNSTSSSEETGSVSEVRYVYLNKGGNVRDEEFILGGIGYDVDLDLDKLFCATTVNEHNHTGTTRCYARRYRNTVIGWKFAQLGEDVQPLMKGNGAWLGVEPHSTGPSVALVANRENAMFATGYQSVVIHDGEEVPGVVRFYRLGEM